MQKSDFVYEKKLGAGAFGCVYRVRWKSNNSLFVIKEQIGRSSIEMVKNEVEILRKMRHPNVIAYYRSWQEDRKGFILMEYASRGTLKELLDKYNKPFPEEDALYLFSQLALGIHHIHQQSVLHRDLKPNNIMLHGARGDIIKIGDFGISKSIKETLAQTRVGTKFYMAPEVLEGRQYDYKCDIWSCGIILYELLTNSFPFNTNNYFEMIDQIRRGRFRRILRNDLRLGTLDLTYKMLRRNPADRPGSNQLVLCPMLTPSIAQVYLNVGRVEKSMILGLDTFRNYLGQNEIKG